MHFVYRLVEVTVASLGLHGTLSFQLCLAAGLQERERERREGRWKVAIAPITVYTVKTTTYLGVHKYEGQLGAQLTTQGAQEELHFDGIGDYNAKGIASILAGNPAKGSN